MALWRGIVENSAARLFAAAVNLAVLVVTARELGPDGRGVLAAATTWVTLLATSAGLSLGQVSHHQIQERRGAEWLPELAGTMLLLAMIASVLACVALLYLTLGDHAGLFRGIPLSVIGISGLLIPLLVLDEYARNLLAAAGHSRRYAIAQTAGHTLRLLLVIVAMGPLNLGVSGVMAGIVISQLVIVALEGQALWNASGRRVRASLKQARLLLAGALRLHPNTVASFLLAYANILLLNKFATTAAVGWYQLALQLAGALLLVPQAAAMMLYGKVAQDGPDGAWLMQKRLMLQVLGTMALLGAVAAVFAPTLISYIAGAEFAPAAGIFRWLLAAVLGLSIAEMMAPQWYGRGILLTSSVLTCVTAVANIALNVVLIRRYGVVGAAWGAAISYLTLVVVAQACFALWCEASYRRRREYPVLAQPDRSSGRTRTG